MKKALLLTTALFLISGCGTVRVVSTSSDENYSPEVNPVTVEEANVAEPVAFTGAQAVKELPLEVHWFRNSAEKRAIYTQTYWLAKRQIETISRGREPGTWAVSLDADETILDNSQFQVEMIAAGATFNYEIWDAWCRRAAAPALPGAVDFTHFVKELGGMVVVVTNRSVRTETETMQNLTNLGVPYDLVLCKDETSDKEPRYDSITNGTASDALPPLDILMWVGDNIHDFPHTKQDIRLKSDDAFTPFGTRFIVLPNPMYGSWANNPM